MTTKPSSRNAEGVFEPFHIDRVPTEEHSRGRRFASRFKELAAFGGRTRVGVRLTGEGYRKSATMEYWDDQPT